MAERDYRVKYTAVANFGKFLQSLKNVEKRLDALNDKAVKGTKKATAAQEDQTDAIEDTTNARKKDSKVADKAITSETKKEKALLDLIGRVAKARKKALNKGSETLTSKELSDIKELERRTKVYNTIRRTGDAKVQASARKQEQLTANQRLKNRLAEAKLERQIVKDAIKSNNLKRLSDSGRSRGSAEADAKAIRNRLSALRDASAKALADGRQTKAQHLQLLTIINAETRELSAQVRGYASLSDEVREQTKFEREKLKTISDASKASKKDRQEAKAHLDAQLSGYKRLADIFNKQISGKDSSALGRIEGGSGNLVTEVKKAESGLETFMQTLDAVRGKLSPTQVNAYRDSMHNLSLEFGSNAKNFASHAHELASNAAAMAESNRQADEASKKGTRVQRTYSKLTGVMKAVGGSFYQVKAAFLGLGIATVAFSLQSIVSLLAAAGGAAVVFANALAQLGGVIATVPGGILAVAAAAGGVALAFRGVGKAFSLFAKENGPPVPKTYAEALAQMAPAARKVVGALTDLYPAWQKVQKAAQKSFFGPIVPQISNFKTILGSLRPLLVSAAGAVGKVAAKGVEMMASGPWQESFSRLSESNVKVIGSLGDALLSVMDAFRLIADAARPLTEFVGQTIAGLADDFRNWSSSLNENSFDTVGTRLTQFISIIKSFGSIISSVFKAAGDTTDWLMQRFDAVAKGWAVTVKGASQEGGKLNKFFDDLKPVLSEVGKLFGDIFRGLASMVDLGALTTSIGVIRTELLPAVFELMRVLGQPENMDKFIRAIASITSIFAKLIDSGVLTFVTSLITVFDVLATILNTFASIPVIGQFVELAGMLAGGAAAAVVLIGLYDKMATRIRRLGAVATAAGTKLALLNAAETDENVGGFPASRTKTKQKPSPVSPAATVPNLFPVGSTKGAKGAAGSVSKAGAAAKGATAAFSRLGSVAGKALGLVGRFGKLLLGFVGGPVGLALTAAFGVYELTQWIDETKNAARAADLGKKSTDEWAKSFKAVAESQKSVRETRQANPGAAASNPQDQQSIYQGLLNDDNFQKQASEAKANISKLRGELTDALVLDDATGARENLDSWFKGLATSAKAVEFNEFSSNLLLAIDVTKKAGLSLDSLNEKLPETAALLQQYGVSFEQFDSDPTARARVGVNTYFDTLSRNKDLAAQAKASSDQIAKGFIDLAAASQKAHASGTNLSKTNAQGIPILTAYGQKINEQRLAIEQERAALAASGTAASVVESQYKTRMQQLIASIPLTRANAASIEQMNAAIGKTVLVLTQTDGKSVSIDVSATNSDKVVSQLLQVDGVAKSADGQSVTIPVTALTESAKQSLLSLNGAKEDAAGGVEIPVEALSNPDVLKGLADTAKKAQEADDENVAIDVQAENASNVRDALNEVAVAQDGIDRNVDIAIRTTKTTETVGSNKGGRIGSASIPTHRFARGGGVPGVGDEDTVPAMLTPGEYVLPKKVVKAIGTSRLDKLRSAGSRAGQVIQYFAGGSPGGVKKKRAAGLNADQREALAGANAGNDLGYKAGYLKAYNEAAAQFKLSKSSEKTQALARVKDAAQEAAANRNRLISSRQLERDEIALARAHRDQRQAVLDAAKANRDATRAYEDAETAYNNRGLAADTIQSNFDQAKQTYQRTMADSNATAADRRAAEVAWRQAQLDRSNAERQLGRDTADFLDYVKPSEQNRQQSIREGVDPANDALADFTYTIIDLNAALRETQKVINPNVATPAKGKVAAGKKRATGGTVDALREYLVGERGPELFLPAERGRVVTAAQTARILGGGISSPFDFGNLVPSVPSLSVPSAPSASTISGSSSSSSINNSKNVSVGSMTINNPYRERSTDSIQRQLKKMTSREY